VAKFAYNSQETFERGLKIGELLNSSGSIRAPVALRSRRPPQRDGRGSAGWWHPLAVMSFVPGASITLEEAGPEVIRSAGRRTCPTT
jgi:hypothetical protein